MVAKKDGEEGEALSKNLTVKKKPSMGLFLDSQETLLVIKYPFRKAGTNISKQPTARGQAKKKPQKSCVSKKKVSESEPKKHHQGHLNMQIDQEKLSQCCKIVNECI